MDFHCHLDLYPDARKVYAETLRRVEFTWLVTTSPRAFAATSEILPTHPRLSLSPGLHPEVADKKQGELPQLLEQIQHSQLVGEVGLDGSARYRQHFELQLQIFTAVIQRCQSLGGRVLSIHSRAAAAEVLDTLQAHEGFGLAVLHWFTDSPSLLRRAVALGCWFSVGPAMLQSANGRKLVAQMPRDRVVPESDGPFAKYEGEPVMPWHSLRVADGLSTAWAISQTEAVTTLCVNGERLIQKMRTELGRQSQ
ncbi:Qat anti-phage system TatD family nuclease QatD [Uliginosibacterium sediminicola]|uniref:Qat anti-phage system TatD family nuclease QatD n=1 Tax=Uliginosibacterium sediminicola TaxID=2024550 RepID=UPI003D0AC56A